MQSILDRLRERLGRPVTLNSALRCPAHTKAVGGVEGSEHGEGDGVDIRVSGSRERFNIVTAALSLGVTRIGIGKTFVHLGTSIKHDLAVIWLYS
jgi:uncharacterized protein YcbK (DUF882 family)